MLLITSTFCPIYVCCCPCSCLTMTNSFCHRCRTFPIRGFQIYDGPVQLTQSTFRGFMPRLERYTSAVGFSLKNTWQLTPRNNLSHLSFQSTVSQCVVLKMICFIVVEYSVSVVINDLLGETLDGFHLLHFVLIGN